MRSVSQGNKNVNLVIANVVQQQQQQRQERVPDVALETHPSGSGQKKCQKGDGTCCVARHCQRDRET